MPNFLQNYFPEFYFKKCFRSFSFYLALNPYLNTKNKSFVLIVLLNLQEILYYFLFFKEMYWILSSSQIYLFFCISAGVEQSVCQVPNLPALHTGSFLVIIGYTKLFQFYKSFEQCTKFKYFYIDWHSVILVNKCNQILKKTWIF